MSGQPSGVGTWTCATCGHQGATLNEHEGSAYIVRPIGMGAHQCQMP